MTETFYDSEGNPRTALEMVRLEPEWAADRLTEALEDCQALARLEQTNHEQALRIRELEAELGRISEELGLPRTIGPAPGWLKRNLDDGGEAAKRVRTLELALRILAEAADAYAADQSHATDQRVGLVQPITVDEGEALNQALERAWGLLRGNAQLSGDAKRRPA